MNRGDQSSVAVHAQFTRREHVIGFTVDEHDAVFARGFHVPAGIKDPP